jgi:hypothetical protein
MDLGPKTPDRLIRIRVDEQVLRFHSGSIHEATWEIAPDDDASCLNLMSLKCISYYDSDHTLSSDYTFYALAKLPNQCKYLVLCENSVDCGVFVLQGGSYTSLKSSSGLFTSLAKDCYIIFKRSRDDVLETNGFFFTEKPVLIGHRKNTVSGKTLQDILSINSYDSGSAQNRVRMVAMEGLGQMDESYPSLEEPVGQMPGDFVTGITRNEFNTTILGGADFVCKPSQVPVRQAIDVLRRQEDREWKLLSDAAIPSAEVQLESLHLDVDSGIFHLSAIPKAPGGIYMTTRELLESIMKELPIEMTEKCSTPFVSRGKQWRFCQLSDTKPTIFHKGIYVRLPQPDHTNESIKIWIHFPESKELKWPEKFLDTIREAFDCVAKSIVELNPCSQVEILLNILKQKSSSQIARIPGGITLSIASFLLISRIFPQVELVFETYNGKQKGLSTAVNVNDGVPELFEASEILVDSCVRTDSLFAIISKLILNKTFSLVVGSSSFGFGFRATYKRATASELLVLASLNLGLSENAKVQLFPLAYLDKDICPNSSTPSEKSKTYSIGVRRSQFYLECWSMHKASNISSLWSYSRTGQNLKAATSASQSDACATLNTSVLRNGMLDTCKKFDQSFELSSETGGSRFEIAVKPALVVQKKNLILKNDHFIFNFHESIELCWEHIRSNVRFDDNQTIVKFGVLNTAACFIGYRAALDELSVSTPGSPSQQELFCFVRYMNATLHSLCNGLYADGQNPKLFLSKWGLAAGRPLALIPTIPLLVWERIRMWDMSCPLPTVEAPFSDRVPAEQPNQIQLRIAENTDMAQIEDCMICWSCKELFFGNFDTRYTLLQDHLKRYNHWVDLTKKIKSVDGKMWRINFEKKRKDFETKLSSVEGSDDQRWAYRLAMTWTNLCLVGVPGSGKTWVIKNLGLLLETIFFKPGEIIFCSPLGRVAMNLHPDARTIHRIIKIKPSSDRHFPESLEQLANHLGRINPRPFTNLKLIVGTEMFMCTTPHLQSLLQFVQKSLQNMDVKVLFDGDPIQLSTSCKNSSGAITSGIPFLITPELNTACPGIRHVVFEDTLHFRIQNQDKLRHLKLMRSRLADESTLKFFKDTCIDTSKPFLTLFATVAAASKFNDKKFIEHFLSQKHATEILLHSEDTHVDSQARVQIEESEVRDLPVETVIKVASGVPIIVVQNCMGIPMGKDDRKSTQVFVGNGAAGIFVRLEEEKIVVKLTMAGKDSLFLLSRVEFSVETQNGRIFVRRQFPIMLAWATNIHKVQGMQFDQLQVNFELGSRDGANEFYEGMAYMALSRANAVQIIGGIHLKLLNNVNIRNLQWWEKELENWKAFKSGNVSKFVFRNNIHESNHRLAALHSRYLIVARDTHASSQECDIDIDDASPPNLFNCQPYFASGSPSATVSLASASVPISLDIGSASVPAPILVHAPASALAPASAPHNLLDPALTPAPAPQKRRQANVSGPTLHGICNFFMPDPDFELVVGSPHDYPEPEPKKQKHKLKWVVKNFIRSSFEPMKIRGHASMASLAKMTQMLSVSIENLNMPEFKCKVAGHPDTYGEVTPALVNHMLKTYSREVSMTCEERSAFIDLGSGHGGLVCLIATLRRFRLCFGVELEPQRASYADPLADSFLKEVQRRNIRHSSVEIIAGNFLKCETTRSNLQMASLIWVNNVKFEDFNYTLLKMLDEVVPVGCIVASFVSFITRQNDTGFREISEEFVENAADWKQQKSKCKVYVIQKQQK